jgi:hypothetical protein
MRNGNLFRKIIVPVALLCGLVLTACSGQDLTSQQREQAETSSYPVVKMLLDNDYRAVRITDIQESDAAGADTQPAQVMFRKCPPTYAFEKCAEGHGTFDTPQVIMDAQVSHDGRISLTGLKELKASILGYGTTRQWTCRPVGDFAVTDVSLTYAGKVFRSFNGRNEEGTASVPLDSPATPAARSMTWNCTHN